MGGCNGCIDLDDVSNSGLAGIVEALENVYSFDPGFNQIVSRYIHQYTLEQRQY